MYQFCRVEHSYIRASNKTKHRYVKWDDTSGQPFRKLCEWLIYLFYGAYKSPHIFISTLRKTCLIDTYTIFKNIEICSFLCIIPLI